MIGKRCSRRTAMNMRGMSGKLKHMWHSSPSPKYSTTSSGHWLTSASMIRFGVGGVDLGPDPAQQLVGRRQVLAGGPFGLVQVGHGIEAEPVDPEVEPEADDAEHRLDHLGVVVVQVGLVVEETVPVVLLADRGRRSSWTARRRRRSTRTSAKPWSSSAHMYQSALGLSRDDRDSTNQGCWSLVWFITRSEMIRIPRRWASSTTAGEVVEAPELGRDGHEVAYVVAAVMQGRGVEGQQPEAVDAEPFAGSRASRAGPRSRRSRRRWSRRSLAGSSS